MVVGGREEGERRRLVEGAGEGGEGEAEEERVSGNRGGGAVGVGGEGPRQREEGGGEEDIRAEDSPAQERSVFNFGSSNLSLRNDAEAVYALQSNGWHTHAKFSLTYSSFGSWRSQLMFCSIVIKKKM